jgi:hypothetical protein
MLVLACLGTGVSGEHQYVRIWTPLQRRYFTSYVWSAVPISRRGSYELLVIVDQTEQRTALDADVVSANATPGGDAFGLSTRAVSRGAVRLTWERSEWDHTALHAFLRHGIYQDQTLLDLARPALWWGASTVFVAALVTAVADTIARRVSRRAVGPRCERSACLSNRAWTASRRPWFIARGDRYRGDR